MLALVLERQTTFAVAFLESCSYPVEEFNSLSINLQEKEEDSVPDATIYIDKKKALFIESKIGSWIDTDQVVAHLRSGKGRIPLVCITGGVKNPEGIDQALEKLGDKKKNLVKWISWRQLYQTVGNMPPEIAKFEEVSSFVRSLESENLVGFTGHRSKELEGLSDFVSRYNIVLPKASQLVEDIELFLSSEEEGIERTKFVRDGRSTTGLDSISFCDYAFSHKDWKDCGYDATREWVSEEGSFAAISFVFDEAKVQIWGRAAFSTIERVDKESWEDILQKLKDNDFYISLLSEGAKDFEDLEVERALDRFAEGTVRVFDFVREHNLEEKLLEEPNEVINELANELLWVLRFLEQNEIFTLNSQQ